MTVLRTDLMNAAGAPNLLYIMYCAMCAGGDNEVPVMLQLPRSQTQVFQRVESRIETSGVGSICGGA